MALTRRGKIAIGAVAAAIGVVAILGFTGNAPDPLQNLVDTVTGRPTPCPLTGELRAGGKDAPSRPMLAVKVENTDAAYPLAGLDRADVVYEELVEGGLTRFVVLYQCRDAARVGPVRSARTTDPKILVQFAEEPLLAYSGAAAVVNQAVDDAGIVSFTETSATEAFARDDTRAAPHNLYVSTKALYRAARKAAAMSPAPAGVFLFEDDVTMPNRPTAVARVTFSFSTTAEWVWSRHRWVRHLDGEPMVLENGAPITADNVVIQEVVVTESQIVDAAGAHSPEVDLTGSGRVWILRDGRRIAGRWERASLTEGTAFVTKGGDEIALARGTTFVELVPKDGGEVAFER